MRKAFLLVGFILTSTIQAQESRPATPAEQRAVELSVIARVVAMPMYSSVFAGTKGLFDPRLFFTDVSKSDIDWEKAWGRRTPGPEYEARTDPDSAEIATVARSLGIHPMAVPANCVGAVTCDTDTLPRIFFTQAMVRGDSAQLRLYRSSYSHKESHPELRTPADMVNEAYVTYFLLVHRASGWAVVNSAISPPASRAGG